MIMLQGTVIASDYREPMALPINRQIDLSVWEGILIPSHGAGIRQGEMPAFPSPELQVPSVFKSVVTNMHKESRVQTPTSIRLILLSNC